LPSPFELMPASLATAEVAARGDKKIESALLRLWDCWELLNEARYALLEADASRVWYDEVREPPDRTTAIYFSRYYLEDAALRAYAGCERMLRSIPEYWRVPQPKGSKRARGIPLLTTTIRRLSAWRLSHPVLLWLKGLDENPEWRQCMQIRKDWVHGQRPNIVGLGPPMSMTFTRTELPGCVVDQVGVKQLGQTPIEELRRTVREAYIALFDVYANLFQLVSSELKAGRPGWVEGTPRS
jgi:hypothetical protein